MAQIWSNNASSSSTSTGLQLPSRNASNGVGAGAGGGMPNQTSLKGGRGVTTDPSLGGKNDEPLEKSTDVSSLNDAVGSSGVDIGAEEESMRLANERLQAASAQMAGSGSASGNAAYVDRSRKQDFIDPNLLADVVKKIAAAFQLRTLEPDTIPLIALATRHRLQSLISSAVSARDHRITATHLRVPPFTTRKSRKRKSSGANVSEAEEDDGEDDEDEDDGEDDFEFDDDAMMGGNTAKRLKRAASKGKGKGRSKSEPEPAFDVLVLSEPERLLSALERVDREEERKQRRARMLRDEREQEERDLAEAVAASEAAEREKEGGANAPVDLGAKFLMGGSTPSAGGSKSGGGEETPKGKGKREKKEKGVKGVKGAKGEGGTASKKAPSSKKKDSQLSEDVKKRLTDQVAMRSIGGRSFSWLNNAGGVASSPSSSFGSPSSSTLGGLPRPKFAPASSLPPPNFAPASPSPSSTNNFANQFLPHQHSHLSTSTIAQPSPLSRSGVPSLHAANIGGSSLLFPGAGGNGESEGLVNGQKEVQSSDLIFALEKERGMGVGRGSGRNTLVRYRAGIGAMGRGGAQGARRS